MKATNARPEPARYKVAVLTWIAIYPSITLTLWVLRPLGIPNLPLPLQTLALTMVLVPGMTFLLMPALTRLLRRWLHTTPHQTSRAGHRHTEELNHP